MTSAVLLVSLLGSAVAFPASTNVSWPDDLPLEWNWCDEGYCSAIKTQCGGTCINNAHMATIESRIALALHGHPRAARTAKPPPTTTFSLQPFDKCSDDANFTAKNLPDWIQKYGLYDEATWPAGGACHMCNREVAECTADCALDALKSSCDSKSYHKAVASKDPCLCTSLSGSIGAGRSLEDLQEECRSNLVNRKFAPCSCERMMHDPSIKPTYTGEQAAKFGSAVFDYDTWGPIAPNSTHGGPETRDAGFARSLFVRGPSMAHTHVHTHDWFEDPAKVKVRCDTTSGHMVTMVGWNRTAAQPYWILRNSWSNVSTATNEGFMYIAMDCNCSGKTGLCEDLN